MGTDSSGMKVWVSKKRDKTWWGACWSVGNIKYVVEADSYKELLRSCDQLLKWGLYGRYLCFLSSTYLSCSITSTERILVVIIFMLGDTKRISLKEPYHIF